jgi:hypothetical protein
VPAAVAAVLRGLLQPDRERRIATAAQALQQLEAWPGFRWAITELEAIYAAALGPRQNQNQKSQKEEEQGLPPWVESRASVRSQPQSDAAVSHGRRPWDGNGSSPTAANDSGRANRRATTVPNVPAKRGVAKPTLEQDAAVPSRRRRTVSVPAWAEEDPPTLVVTDELPGPDELDTRVLPAAERNPQLASEPMERLVTRRHPAALAEPDVPSARTSAEIAVTMPQPSRHAPWAAGTDPIGQRLVQPEPGAPIKRRRSLDSTESAPVAVAPRHREGAAVHRAAPGGKPGVVAGEIVTDEGFGPLASPLWRASSR